MTGSLLEKNKQAVADNLDFSDDETIVAVNRTVNRSIVVAFTEESLNNDSKSKKSVLKNPDFRKKVHEFPACSM